MKNTDLHIKILLQKRKSITKDIIFRILEKIAVPLCSSNLRPWSRFDKAMCNGHRFCRHFFCVTPQKKTMRLVAAKQDAHRSEKASTCLCFRQLSHETE